MVIKYIYIVLLHIFGCSNIEQPSTSTITLCFKVECVRWTDDWAHSPGFYDIILYLDNRLQRKKQGNYCRWQKVH